MSVFRVSSDNPIDRGCLQQLRDTVEPGPVLILTHENPDPDALASGKAFSTLFKVAWGISSHLVYSGLVSRAENKAMLSLLMPEWENWEEIPEIDRYKALVLVDSQPGAGNNNLPEGLIPQVVIDHHFPLREELNLCDFVDVRSEMDSTASMTYQYLEAANILPDEKLATAIFYGIHADTIGLSRGGSSIDQAIYIKLLQLIDRDILSQIEQAKLPREYFSAFTRGLQAACIYGKVVICNLGEMHRPDFVAEMADLLIRLENTSAALCLGSHDADIYISLRTMEPDVVAGILIQDMILPPAKAGGHGNIAGGRIPFEPGKFEQVATQITNRFLELMGENRKGEKLLS